MKQKIMIEKVTELEWFLTMQSYHDNYHPAGQNVCSNAENNNMTLDSFHKFYEGIKPPIVWKESETIGFFCPFNDELVIEPKACVEIPIGFSIEGNFTWIQPMPETLLFSNRKIKGDSNAKGSVIVVTNISDEPFLLKLIANKPLCALNLQTKEKKLPEMDATKKVKTDSPNKYCIPVSIKQNGTSMERHIYIDIPTLEKIVFEMENGFETL